LQSGSNGNAIYVEAGDVRLLFDAGISAAQVRQRLAVHGRSARDADALILSHRHSDHTCCAGVYHRLFHVPLYATPATRRAISPFAGKLTDVRSFAPGQTLQFDGVAVHTLPTPHDAAESCAFIVEHEGRRLGIFTDLGHPFDALARTLAQIDAAYLESNYDPQMLADGPYPPELKARICGPGGHLSNPEAADLLKAGRRDGLSWIALAHLSEHNNAPDIALATHRSVLGRDYPLYVASRYEVSPLLSV
jgi:phosphoribosyl 1,2-cyclic phosphodiesterase